MNMIKKKIRGFQQGIKLGQARVAHKFEKLGKKNVIVK